MRRVAARSAPILTAMNVRRPAGPFARPCDSARMTRPALLRQKLTESRRSWPPGISSRGLHQSGATRLESGADPTIVGRWRAKRRGGSSDVRDPFLVQARRHCLRFPCARLPLGTLADGRLVLDSGISQPTPRSRLSMPSLRRRWPTASYVHATPRVIPRDTRSTDRFALPGGHSDSSPRR